MKAQTVEQTIEIEVSEGRINKVIIEANNTKPIIFSMYPKEKEVILNPSIKNLAFYFFVENASIEDMDDLCIKLQGEDKELLRNVIQENLNLMSRYLVELQ